MSYPRDLDEYSDEELREEIARREDCRARGVCDYCGKNGNAPKCRFKNRHPNRERKQAKASAFEIANTCNACGKQMERGAVMVCHACAGKRVLHPTPLKIGETIRWPKDDLVLERPTEDKLCPHARVGRRRCPKCRPMKPGV